MATVTQAQLTCDVCGDTKNIKTRTFGLDGKAYVIDLCRKDGNALDRAAARYTSKSRKVTAKRGSRRRGGKRRPRAKTSRSQPQNAWGWSTTAAKAVGGQQQKGMFVYGSLPADIGVAAVTPGIGEHRCLL